MRKSLNKRSPETITSDEIKELLISPNDYTCKEVCEILNIWQVQLHLLIKKYELTKFNRFRQIAASGNFGRFPDKLTILERNYDEVCSLLEDKVSYNDIGKKFGCTRFVIECFRKKFNIPTYSKLDKDKEQIENLLNLGYKPNKILTKLSTEVSIETLRKYIKEEIKK